jgi:hypothetical protein
VARGRKAVLAVRAGGAGPAHFAASLLQRLNGGYKMNKKFSAVMGAAALGIALTGCGGANSSTAPSPPPSQVASSAPTTSSSASSAAPSPLDSGTEGVICAGLNALVFTGQGEGAIGTVASTHGVTPEQVQQAITDRCPELQGKVS